MTWIKTATKHGYTEQTLSKAIKRKIANYKKVESSLTDIQKDIDAADAADKPGMEAQFEEVKTGLSELDAEISADIEKYKKNEAFNKQRSEKMQQGRAAKGLNKKSTVVQSKTKKEAPIVAPIEETVITPEAPIVEIPAQVEQPAEVVEQPIIETPETKKKKSYTGLWIGLAAALGLGTFAAVKLKVGPFKK